MKKFLHDALYQSEQSEYRIHLTEKEFKIFIQHPHSVMGHYMSLDVQSNLSENNTVKFTFSIERKTIERTCAILHIVFDQPVKMSFGESGFESPWIQLCV